MEAIQLIQMSPADLRSMIAEEVGKIAQAFKPVQVKTADVPMSKKEAMAFLGIKSYSGLTSWCIDNGVFGKRVGKRTLFMQSEILAALAK